MLNLIKNKIIYLITFTVIKFVTIIGNNSDLDEQKYLLISSHDLTTRLNNWCSINFVNFFLTMNSKLIKELVLTTNQIEIKTVSVHLENCLWILKYSTLTHFEQLIEIVAVDHFKPQNRFKIIYVLRSLLYKTTINLSFTVNENNENIMSISYLFQSGTWLEREVWDMFGIKFKNNSDLRRILTDYGFDKHPLRKDFPLTGFDEIHFDEAYKQILHENVILSQELRNFQFQKTYE